MNALRSGEYVQGRETLSQTYPGGNVTYCCEGVAFERYGKTLGFEVSRTSGGALRGLDPLNVASLGSSLVAPLRFWVEMGMLSDLTWNNFALDVTDREGNQHVRYADMNDSGFTFDQIADLIEWQFQTARSV